MYVDFDKIRLLPADVSHIRSRRECSTEVIVSGIKFSVPFLIPPMRSLYKADTARKVAEFGSCMVVPRNATGNQWVADPLIVNSSIENAMHIATRLMYDFPQENKVLSIEVANGHMQMLAEKVTEVKRAFPSLPIWAGTVVSANAANNLGDAGADAILIGIGVGSACITTKKTGVGLPAFATVDECSESAYPIILTGGLREHGDVAKALAAGATLVYCGALVKGARDLNTPDLYIGEASRTAKTQDHRVGHIEGIELELKSRPQTTVEILKEIQEDLQSAMSYSDTSNLAEFRKHANLVSIV